MTFEVDMTFEETEKFTFAPHKIAFPAKGFSYSWSQVIQAQLYQTMDFFFGSDKAHCKSEKEQKKL
jgi:hypothetical protein